MRTSLGCLGLSLASVAAAWACLGSRSRALRGPAAGALIFVAVVAANQAMDSCFGTVPLNLLVGLVVLAGLTRAYGPKTGILIAGVAAPLFLLGQGGRALGLPAFAWARPEVRAALLGLAVVIASYKSTTP